jgi:Tfp pilus assembly protein PilF
MSFHSKARTTIPRFIGALFLLNLLVGPASGQNQHMEIPDQTTQRETLRTYELHSYELHTGEELVMVSVYTENGKVRLDRQAVLKITNQSTHDVVWKTTGDQSEAGFGLPFGKYEIEVSAVGYLSERKEFRTATRQDTIRIEVALSRDPSAVDLSITEAALPSKARKEAKHGVSALKSGNIEDARRKLEAAYKLAPSNSDLNYLLGYLFYQHNDLDRAQSYLEAAANLNPHHVQALTLLGRLMLLQEDYLVAAATLEKAVAADPDYWMAHNLLADAYLKQMKYEGARQQAELAIAKGKAGASTANLVLGESLVNLGKKEEGIRALKAFVQDSPKNPVVPQVRDLIATLERLSADPTRDADTTRKNTPPSPSVDFLRATPELGVSVKAWRPAGIDEVKPPVAAGVSCPYENVMEMSGGRVKELADNVSRVAANEHLLYKRVDEMGYPATTETRDYDYVASISEEKPGFVTVGEYRSERRSSNNISNETGDTSGFAGLALVFHPSRREDFEMTCEGLGRWHEQAAWIVYFKEHETKHEAFQVFNAGGQSFSSRLKGRAWITADNFQIARIEAELVSPLPEIRLLSEQQVVEYGPVPFPKKKMELWLPQSAEIYLDYRQRRYYRRHSYDHYMLFSVDAEEKRKEPKAFQNQPPE